MGKEHHVMVDLETMGGTPDGAIVAIGAVVFDPHEEKLGAEFYTNVDLRDSSQYGKQDAEVVLWWLNQETEAIKALLVRPLPLTESLRIFSHWLHTEWRDVLGNVFVWGNGAAFDNTILSYAYKATGISKPWSFKNDRCYRTLKSLVPYLAEPEFRGTRHNALDDARHQATHALNLFRELRITTKLTGPNFGQPTEIAP